LETLRQYVKQHDIPSGFVTGIGATERCELGYFDRTKKQYLTKVVEESCELVSLTGNIAWADGEPIIHAHVALGFPDFHIEGGHLVEATVSVTGELYVHRIGQAAHRTLDDVTGLKLLDFSSS